MIERKQSFNWENKLSLQKENNHSGFRAFHIARKKTIRQSLNGCNEIKMYHKKELLQ